MTTDVKDADLYTEQYAYNASNMVEYIGKATTGTATSSAKWQIQKLSYSGSNVTKKEWANGNVNFDKVWDNRASYTYS